MKKIISFLIVVPVAALASDVDLTLYNAQRYGAEAHFVLRVVDHGGFPVAGARIFGGFQTGGNLNDSEPIRGVTDANGEYQVQGKCVGMVRCAISKEGYYSSDLLVRYPDRTSGTPVKNGKWQPYGVTREIILKKMKNPVPLIHSESICPEPPSLGKWYGYDIERRRWVSPFGEGVHSDMLIKISIDAKNEMNDFKTTMEVVFTNNPYAGAYILKTDDFSEMKSIYEAETNASYRSSFKFVHEKHPNIKQTPFFKYVSGAEITDTRLDANSYLVFRTRTKVDDKGNLVSAHYGKIYGLWEFFGGMRAANVKFNPNPNDTNLEDMETVERSKRRQHQREEAPYQKIGKGL